MKLIETSISLQQLKKIAEEGFGDLVKAVVDVEKKIMVIDADLHADEEAYLLSLGSKQENVWGINLYPSLTGENFIEFDSMINVRPSQKNTSRNIEDKNIQKKIKYIVAKLIKNELST